MSNNSALENFKERLKDIDQLLKAHEVITKFNKAESIQTKGRGLQNLPEVISALVSEPGRGKPQEVNAINKAAYTLLVGHFQGFIEELHRECGLRIIGKKASDPEKVINDLGINQKNPRTEIITKMFNGIGIYDVLDGIKWQKSNNKSIKEKIDKMITLRNQIVHGRLVDKQGKQITVTKQKVTQLKIFLTKFSSELDKKVAKVK